MARTIHSEPRAGSAALPCRTLASAALFSLSLACGGADQQAKAQVEAKLDGAPVETSVPTSPFGQPVPGDPPTARRDMFEMLEQDRVTTRHASDGGGRAWIETTDGERPRAQVGVPGTWTIVYEAGELGVATDGTISLLVDPFWYWSTPHTSDEERRGYCEVSTDAAGVKLEARTLDRSLMAVIVTQGQLAQGDTVRIVYGAGPGGALPDRYADRATHFWIRVDGDGDGISGLIDEHPELDVEPGPPAGLVLTLPSTAEPGVPTTLTVAAVDSRANGLWDFAGRVTFDVPEGVELPVEVVFGSSAAGRAKVEVTFEEAGLYTLRGKLFPQGNEGLSPIAGSTNPCLVLAGQPNVLWADLHGHSNLSDGTGTPEDFYEYARDVAGLDVVALTDHDHWGVQFLDENPDIWSHLREVANGFYDPGRFVTLVAYEWTSWIHGHRHVVYFQNEGPLLSSMDEATDDPRELWDALRTEDVLTFAHHSAGGPIATNWDIPPDPELEPVTEIVSVHGSSEALDSPGLIYSPLEGNTVRDALDRGYVFGFLGSGDGHDGHPGLAHKMSPGMAGLAAILAEDRTRESVLAALRERRCYATNGTRMILRASLNGRRMGSSIPLDELADEPALTFLAIGTEDLVGIEVIRSGDIVAAMSVEEGQREVSGSLPLEGLSAGEYVYLRVQQEEQGVAWSSPFYVTD